MKVLVTGGSGFIGSHLVPALIDAGHDVQVLDLVRPLHDVPFEKADIRTLTSLPPTEVIYHLAAEKDIHLALRNPAAFTRTNLDGALNVLRLAAERPLHRFIFASSLWVYDAAAEHHVDEQTPLDPSRAPHLYSRLKLLVEQHIRVSNLLHALPFTLLRFGVVYGPRAKPEGLIPSFVRQSLEGQELTVHGSGDQARSFVHVSDLVRGCLPALMAQAENQTYNLMDSRAYSVNEVAALVRDLHPSRLRQRTLPRHTGDFQGKNVSTAKAKEDLGWEPRIPLKEGIQEYLQWSQQQTLTVA